MTTPICHSDLSPRLSVDDIGYEYGYEYSLSSLSFDFHHHRTSPQKHEPMQTRRNTERNHRPILSGSGAPGAPASASASASASLSLPSNTNTNTNPDHNPGTLVIREEDLRHLADSLGGVLEGADETLSGLESDRNLLPSAIVRRCRELADGLASLAEELEGQSREERERLAGAIRHDLLLCEQYHSNSSNSNNSNSNSSSSNSNSNNSNSNSSSNSNSNSNNSNSNSNNSNSNSNSNYYFDQPPQQEQEHDQPRPSEIDAVTVADETDGVLRALSGASTLLRDVETAFREIGKEEAEEIADAALVMARLFLLSLQSIHSNLLENLTDSNSDHDHHHDSINDHDYDYDNDNYATSVIIEELSANEDGEAMQGEDKIDPQRQTKQQPQPQPQPQTQRRNGNRNRDRDRNRQDRRVRLLWPPLGPGVDAAMSWTKGEAEKRPMLAVALGLTMWPVAISTALVGTSAALIDGAVQDAYDRFRNGPWIASLEQGAAQAYQAGRLTVATGKLLGRQSLRVAARQIERRGGLAPIAGDLRDMAVDRITHPIDTLGKVWDGVHWGFGAVRDATDEFLSMRRERRREAMI